MRKKQKNVFEEIGATPEESINLEVRARLMILLKKEIRKMNLSQVQAAKLLGVKPPRISELMHGKIGKFSIDLLVRYLSRMGKRVEFKILKSAAA